MNADPTSITPAQIRAAYDALGLDPDGWDLTYGIEVDAGSRVTVRRYRRDPERGGLASVGRNPVSEIVEVAIVHTRPKAADDGH